MHFIKILILGMIYMLTAVIATQASEVQTPYKPRAFFNAKFEPKSTVYHGAGQDPAGFNEYRKAIGPLQSPIIYMNYIGIARGPKELVSWGKRLKAQLKALDNPSVMPQIGVSLKGGKGPGATGDAAFAEGKKDDNIEAFCQAVKALDRPVFIRIGYEFEGNWNGYKPETYKAAFIRITKALRKHKVKAATVWCSGGSSSGEPIEKVMNYYPGDNWVDWWGIDLFSASELPNKKTTDFCDAAAKHRKPVMIGESTPRHVGVLKGQASWDKWFAPYFALIRERPEIKAFCYINWEWKHWSDKLGHKWHSWGDCRVQKNKYVMQQYKKEMRLPLYEHAKPDRHQSEQTPAESLLNGK